ncbi:DNA adenine methylase [Bradyrhizobium elkanii]|uniref:helix-turn-helix domain-containing protein n=1 Tax=Bradyrhizobium TaxID=374 RepID=UPI0021688E03|nr:MULTISPECIES: helix-turn-helix transcriptional regulator [Bradyrhizobium]MCS3928996.1 DNA adenine methylase [Bradyrhizobium elkanii]MCS3969552.1 DNA adenine methylase [Bradyrhizobium japonicum]
MTASESFLKTQSLLRDSLARSVRRLRLSSRMSQRDLADRAGVRQALISQIEVGAANVTLDSLLKIAIALQVDVETLFAREAKARPLETVGTSRHSP